MTDVDGPPVPVLRFSSLLIRGAEADDFAGTDGQALKVDCNMAQAFEIPKRGDRTAYPGPCAIGSGESRPRGTQQRIFQIAAPGPTRWPDRHSEYGSAAGSPQAH